MGLWTSRRQAEEGGGTPGEEGGEVGRDEAGEDDGVIPWSAEALEAAAALGEERARRRANYGKRRPREEVGAPAPFGRHVLFFCYGRRNIWMCISVDWHLYLALER